MPSKANKIPWNRMPTWVHVDLGVLLKRAVEEAISGPSSGVAAAHVEEHEDSEENKILPTWVHVDLGVLERAVKDAILGPSSGVSATHVEQHEDSEENKILPIWVHVDLGVLQEGCWRGHLS